MIIPSYLIAAAQASPPAALEEIMAVGRGDVTHAGDAL